VHGTSNQTMETLPDIKINSGMKELHDKGEKHHVATVTHTYKTRYVEHVYVEKFRRHTSAIEGVNTINMTLVFAPIC